MGCAVTVVDYGMGNLWSVRNALSYLGCDAALSGDSKVVARSEALILPGVGSFRRAMERLRAAHLDEAIHEAVTVRGRKILGICLGLQLMGLRGSEDGDVAGLGLIDAPVDRFVIADNDPVKIPHVGFNMVRRPEETRLFRTLPDEAAFYFVHSYRMLPDHLGNAAATCHHGETFVAAYERDNVFAAQFHPEKSQTNGLILLRNFLEQ